MLTFSCYAHWRPSLSPGAPQVTPPTSEISIRSRLADWLHLLAVASLGGTLVALALIFPPSLVAGDSPMQRLVAGLADRYYILFGPLLFILMFTGIYNASYLVGSFPALVKTPYGIMLSAKVLLLIVLGTIYIALPEQGRDESLFVSHFLHWIRIEAVLVMVVLLCASIMVCLIPARHAYHLGHTGETSLSVHPAAPGSEPNVSLETDPVKIMVGTPVMMMVHLRRHDGMPLEHLTISHDRILHAIIIGSDLDVFAHIHPEDIGPVTAAMVKKADLPLLFTFPKAGDYLIGLDFAAADESYSKTFSVHVANGVPMAKPTIDFSARKVFGEYWVSWQCSRKRLQQAGEQLSSIQSKRTGPR